MLQFDLLFFLGYWRSKENNGRIAPLIATGCAAGAAGLFALGILPMSFQKHQASPPVPEYPFRSYWGKAVGFFVYCIVLLCWKPRKTVFLDALCINDDDDRWKCAALLSMPVFLKAADSLLVLWDETYTQRMWCCFEIASFLHAHPGNFVVRYCNFRSLPFLGLLGFLLRQLKV